MTSCVEVGVRVKLGCVKEGERVMMRRVELVKKFTSKWCECSSLF